MALPSLIRGEGATCCHSCPVRKQTVCSVYLESELAVLNSIRLGDRFFPSDTHVFDQGSHSDEFYTVISGWLAAYTIRTDGQKQIHEFILPGAFVGYEPDQAHTVGFGLKCLTDTRLCAFSRHKFLTLCQSDSRLAMRLAHLMSVQRHSAWRFLTDCLHLPARQRVAKFLLDLHEQANQSATPAQPQQTRLPLTQEDIASAVGLTNVYVSRTLRLLREEGILQFRAGLLTILNKRRLHALLNEQMSDGYTISA